MASADIGVRVVSSGPPSYRLAVTVREGKSQTTHDVTLSHDLLARLGPGQPADAFVQRCFAFLLEREPKESILERFDVSVIGRYFPDFEKTIVRP
jgi:hypothetical protein